MDEVWVYENGVRMKMKFSCESLIIKLVVDAYFKVGISNEDTRDLFRRD